MSLLPVTVVDDSQLELYFKEIAKNGSEILLAIDFFNYLANKYKKDDDLFVSVKCVCHRIESYIESMSSKINREETIHNVIAKSMTNHIITHKDYIVKATTESEVYLPGYNDLAKMRTTFTQKDDAINQSYNSIPKTSNIMNMTQTYNPNLALALDNRSIIACYQSLLPIGYMFNVIDSSNTPPVYKRQELASVCWAYYTILVCFYDIAIDRNKALGRSADNNQFLNFLKSPLNGEYTYGQWLRKILALYSDFTYDFRMAVVHQGTSVKKTISGLKNGDGIKNIIEKIKNITETGNVDDIMSLLPSFLPS